MFRSVMFCQEIVLQALDKEHNNCSATPEASCKLFYAASFPLLYFSCHRSVNEQKLLRWHPLILLHCCILDSLELGWFTSISVIHVCWLPYLDKYLCSAKIQTYKFKWSNLFYLPILTDKNILIIVHQLHPLLKLKFKYRNNW